MSISPSDLRAFAKLLAEPSADLYGDNTASLMGQQVPGVAGMSSYGRAINPEILPIQGKVTQAFGVPQSVAAAGEKIHGGVDIAAALGTPVPEVTGGVVLQVNDYGKSGYGKSVVIKGTDGRIRRYSHLSQFGVKQGQRVNKGDIIGLVGSTGASTGSHLDYRELLSE